MLWSLATLGQLLAEPGMELAVLSLRLVKGAVLIAVSTILFRRRQTDVVAAMLALAFLTWTISSSFDFSSSASPAWAMPLDRLRFLLFVLALLLFPNGEWRPRWTSKVAAASAAVFALGIAEAFGLVGTRLYLPAAIACVLAALHALVLRYRMRSTGPERQQLQWVALGLVAGIGMILSARTGTAIQAPVDPILLECLFQLGIVVLALGFLVSLLRYRLYDAETVISRSAAYAALTLALVATFTASEVFIEGLGQNYLGAEIGNLAGALAAGVAAMLLAPLHNRITAWAERHFQRDLTTLKEGLPELLAELPGSSSTARVGQLALPHVVQALHSTRSALLVDGRVAATTGTDRASAERWARYWLPIDSERAFEHDASSEFSLRMALRCPFGSLRGWLLLGPRPDCTPYSGDDLDALKAIGPALRTALFAAREREKEREQELAAQRSIRRNLDQLMARVAVLEAATETKARLG